jgi:hypothetical protein
MIVSPNKMAAAGLSLGSKLDFFTVTTVADLTVAANLNALIETIALNGQPVISALDTTTTPGTGVLKFAVEHTGSWTAASLQSAIQAAQVESTDATVYPLVTTATTPFSAATVTLNTL